MQSIFRFQPGTKLLAVLQAWPPGIDYFGLAYQTRKGRVVAKCVQREDNGQIKVFAFGEEQPLLTAERRSRNIPRPLRWTCPAIRRSVLLQHDSEPRLLDWWVSALSSLLNQGEEDIDFFESFR